MPRPRQFDPGEAVNAAMELFWRDGYDGVSFDDLVAATGASRRGLYSLWDSKQELFVEALARYRREVGDHFFTDLERPDSGRTEIAAFWNRFEAGARSGGERSCLVMKTAQHPVHHCAGVGAEIEAYFTRFRVAFEGALARASGSADIALAHPPATVARLALGIATAVASETARNGYSDEAERLIGAGRAVSGVRPPASPS